MNSAARTPLVEDEQGARAWLRDCARADDLAMDRLERLVALLLIENERQNLVAKGSLDRVWQRHIVDSAQLLHVPRETIPDGSWLDLGTGAGFPGLVIAALQPERHCVLVDSRRLRTEWVAHAADVLGLSNVSVCLSDVARLPAQRHAVISARAFAPLPKLLALSARFSTPDTVWLLPKGAGAQQELDDLPKEWAHMFHVEQSLTSAEAGIIVGRLLAGGSQSQQGQSQNRGRNA